MKRQYIFLLALAAPLALCASSPDTISTYAGGGPNNTPAATANVAYPVATALDSAGNLYFVTSEGGNGIPANRVYKVNTSGTVTVVAGNGFAGHAGIGGPAPQAELDGPVG
jgi:trimeric autotransporter adhesin